MPSATRHRREASECDATERRFDAWLRTAPGQRLLTAERPLLRDAARRCHGDALLWIGATPELLDTTSRCMVRCRVFASRGGCVRCDAGAAEATWRDVSMVAADAAELPFASASVDGVVLHHALEVAADRRGALREATRVLRPGGRLLVLGLNPLSLWLLAKPLPTFAGLSPVSVPRLHDWLALLGLRREGRTVYLNYRSVLPLALAGRRWQRFGGWLRRLQAPVGGTYLVVATKTAHGFISQPRALADEAAAGAAPPALAASATRQASE